MALKEFNIKTLKMNTMEVGFEECKVVVNIFEVEKDVLRIGWYMHIGFIETDLKMFYKHEREIDLELITDNGDVLRGQGIVSAMEEKKFTEITGIGVLEGSFP